MVAAWKACSVVALALLGVAGTARAGHDFDGDGRADVLWRNTSTGANVIWLRSDATAQRTVARVADTRWAVVGQGDFDGDGRSDLFWRNLGTGANVIWRAGDAARPLSVVAVTDTRWQVAGIADFDADGHADVLWRHSSSGANAIWRSGNAAMRRAVASVTDLRWVVAGVGDFDHDGHADVFWRNVASGANAIWRSANAATPLAVTGVTDVAWQVAAVGDFDGNGTDDVFWRHLVSGRNAIWRGGNAASGIAVPAVSDLSWQIAASGDFDGDGRADVLWREFVHGPNVVWRGALMGTRIAVTGVGNLDWAVVPFEAQPTRPFLSVDALVTIAEGDSGSRPVPFAIRLSHPSALPVSYRYAVHTNEVAVPNGATDATAGSDFAEADGARTISAGRLADAVTALVYGDAAPEPHEAFNVVSYQVVGAQVLWANGVGFIRNDDGMTLWIRDARTVEGNSGETPMTFTIWSSVPSTGTLRVHAATASDPTGLFVATPNVDYVSRQADVSIPAGAVSAPFTVAIIGDLIREVLGEGFRVDLSNASTGAVIVVPRAHGFILDDEPPVIP